MFHNSNLFGSCIIHILYTVCAKIKKIIPAPNALRLKLYFLHTICHNSDIFPPILTICNELLNINKPYQQLPPTCFGHCCTIFRQTIVLFAQKLYAFCSCKRHTVFDITCIWLEQKVVIGCKNAQCGKSQNIKICIYIYRFEERLLPFYSLCEPMPYLIMAEVYSRNV